MSSTTTASPTTKDHHSSTTSSPTSKYPVVDATTLDSKIISGYQGWFFAKGDNGPDRWKHWSETAIPDETTYKFEMWPDLREFPEEELYPTGFTYTDGSNAGLYSSYNEATVQRHFKWMQEYGLDGVFAQRFVRNLDDPKFFDARNKVLMNVKAGAESYGRSFAVMYDISRADNSTVFDDIKNDWMHLVDNLELTLSDRYLHHNGRPVLGLWGFGFKNNNYIENPLDVLALFDWFANAASSKYRPCLVGGIPSHWRTLNNDSRTDPLWDTVYRRFDVLSPWSVGRFGSDAGADNYLNKVILPDMESLVNNDYLPVVFPGYSFSVNNSMKPFNEIPRYGGKFMWHQLRNAVNNAGANMIYVAMFDEVDEATAIYKLAENQSQGPREGKFLYLDADKADDSSLEFVPNDRYLRLTGEATNLIKNKGVKFPEVPSTLLL